MDFIIASLLHALNAIVITTITGFSTAFVSYKLGDITMKNRGFLTLNPKKYFDILGFILFIVLGYGWGVPVDTSALYYKNRKRDSLIVAITPFVACLILAFLGMILATLTMGIGRIRFFFGDFALFCIIFLLLNLIPVYPFYGRKLLHLLLPTNKLIAFSSQERLIQILAFFILLSGVFSEVFYTLAEIILEIISIPINLILG